MRRGAKVTGRCVWFTTAQLVSRCEAIQNLLHEQVTNRRQRNVEAARTIRVGYRAGYWVAEWEGGTDAWMGELTQRCPQLVIGRYIVVASCDSGPYTPTSDKVGAGWRRFGALAYSPKVQSVIEFPTPGFDEWYVYDRNQEFVPHENFVNTWGFSVLSSERERTKAFWDQVIRLEPLHVLGAGSPTLFLVTRDEVLFRAMTDATRHDGGAH